MIVPCCPAGWHRTLGGSDCNRENLRERIWSDFEALPTKTLSNGADAHGTGKYLHPIAGPIGEPRHVAIDPQEHA